MSDHTTGAERDRIDELLSRGLDADLNRDEMRELYGLAARDGRVPAEMGELAALEERLGEVRESVAEAAPRVSLADAVRQSIREAGGDARPGVGRRLLDWLMSPKGFAVQPLSFAVGIAVAAIGLSTVTPVLTRSITQQAAFEPQRLNVIDVQFEDATPRVDWTYQFIVPPGQEARLLIDHGGDRPVKLQFEAAEPVDLAIIHRAPGRHRDVVQGFTVHGIGYASLKNPKPGDKVMVKNGGEVPVLVYAFSPRSSSTSVSQGQSL